MTRRWRVASWTVLAALLGLILAAAWVCDDAYITMRTVDNARRGLGLRWNVAERVQTYTHPLWMLMLLPVYWWTRDAFVSLIVLSLAGSVAALVIVRRAAATPAAGAAALGLLALSRSFVDYSTSGLENPLAHLLVAATLAALWSGRAGDLSLFLLGSLLALTRLDLALLVAPALVLVAARRPWSVPWPLALGALPVLLWEGFSLFYYGFPFPNTAYAKLNTGIPGGELARQGLAYLADSLLRDPLTLATCLAAVALAVVRPSRLSTPIAIGIVLYLLYVVRIGGDYMSGRFLSVPFLCAVLIVCGPGWNAAPALRRYTVACLAGIGLLAMGARLAWPDSDRMRAWLLPSQLPRIIEAGGELSLRTTRSDLDIKGQWAERGRELRRERQDRVVKWGAVGLIGYFAGARVHVLDGVALGDPLLARLPIVRPWWPGHYIRREPDGYEKTLASGSIAIEDANLARYYAVLREVTRGDLFSWTRVTVIAGMNLGRFDYLLEQYGHQAIDAPVTAAGLALDFAAGLALWERGVTLRLSAALSADHVELGAGENQRFLIQYRRNGRVVGEQEIGAPGRFDPMRRTGLKPAFRSFLDFVPPGARDGFDSVDIALVHGEHPGWIGAIRFRKSG